MMAAAAAAECGGRVLLLEKMPRVGRKMMITGKGRCNVTSADEIPDIIKNIVGNGRFLNSSLRAFDNADVMAFFEGLGVPLKTERGNRVFPESDRALDVVDAMLRHLHDQKVEIRTNAAVTSALRAVAYAASALRTARVSRRLPLFSQRAVPPIPRRARRVTATHSRVRRGTRSQSFSPHSSRS